MLGACTPFLVRAGNVNIDRFVVISGCSGGGKSTLLIELGQRGYATVEEPGRRIVKEEMLGAGLALPWARSHDAPSKLPSLTAPLPTVKPVGYSLIGACSMPPPPFSTCPASRRQKPSETAPLLP